MPSRRDDIIKGLQDTVDKYQETTPAGAPIARGKIIKPIDPFPDVTTNPVRLHPTTGGVEPVPVVPVKEKTYIPTYLHQADKKWLKSFLEE